MAPGEWLMLSEGQTRAHIFWTMFSPPPLQTTQLLSPQNPSGSHPWPKAHGDPALALPSDPIPGWPPALCVPRMHWAKRMKPGQIMGYGHDLPTPAKLIICSKGPAPQAAGTEMPILAPRVGTAACSSLRAEHFKTRSPVIILLQLTTGWNRELGGKEVIMEEARGGRAGN